MTCRVLYNRIREMLEKAGCDSPAFDAACLLEDLGGARNFRPTAVLPLNRLPPNGRTDGRSNTFWGNGIFCG